jgi:predicted anti-sigma-YlaC factor YlaD
MTPPADDFPCSLFVELVTDYLDGALPSDEHRRLEEHLDVCGGCTSVLEQFRSAIRTTGALAEEDVTSIAADQREQIMAVFRAWSATRPS